MAAMTSDGLLFLEPASELWSYDLRGLASRLRVVHFDRLRGLTRVAQSLVDTGKWTPLRIERTGIALNPLNEMCEIHLRRVAGPEGHP
jgi:hypothetical protein